MMYEPKIDLYDLLSSIEGVSVYQSRPEVIAEFPTITFYVSNNRVNATLDKEIGYQDLVFEIDIWDKTSIGTAELLSDVESTLRESGYLLDFSTDVPDPDCSHISARFTLVN